jgi:hypothetical protein
LLTAVRRVRGTARACRWPDPGTGLSLRRCGRVHHDRLRRLRNRLAHRGRRGPPRAHGFTAVAEQTVEDGPGVGQTRQRCIELLRRRIGIRQLSRVRRKTRPLRHDRWLDGCGLLDGRRGLIVARQSVAVDQCAIGFPDAARPSLVVEDRGIGFGRPGNASSARMPGLASAREIKRWKLVPVPREAWRIAPVIVPGASTAMK